MNPRPPGRRWLGHRALSLGIAAAWLLLQGSLAVGDLLWAALLGLGLPWLLAPFLGPPSRPHAPLRIARLLLRLAWDIVKANVSVARIVLDPRRPPRPGWVRVPYTLEQPNAVALLCTLVTITPGTVSIFIDEPRREIVLHVLDNTDPQGTVDSILRHYERPLKEILE